MSTRKCYLRNPKGNLLGRNPTVSSRNCFDLHRAAQNVASETRRLTSAEKHGATHTVTVVHGGQILMQLHLSGLISVHLGKGQGIINPLPSPTVSIGYGCALRSDHATHKTQDHGPEEHGKPIGEYANIVLCIDVIHCFPPCWVGGRRDCHPPEPPASVCPLRIGSCFVEKMRNDSG